MEVLTDSIGAVWGWLGGHLWELIVWSTSGNPSPIEWIFLVIVLFGLAHSFGNWREARRAWRLANDPRAKASEAECETSKNNLASEGERIIEFLFYLVAVLISFATPPPMREQLRIQGFVISLLLTLAVFGKSMGSRRDVISRRKVIASVRRMQNGRRWDGTERRHDDHEH